MDYIGPRDHFVNWLRQQLIGPAQTDANLVGISPLERYPVGVLHPVMSYGADENPTTVSEPWEDTIDEEDSADESNQEQETKPHSFAQPAGRRRYVAPSTVGFSIFVRGKPCLQMVVEGAYYKSVGERDIQGRFRTREYQRTPLETQTLSWEAGHSSLSMDTPHALGMHVQSRPFQDGFILTLTLFNQEKIAVETISHERERAILEKSLFEARLTCFVEEGKLAEYPRVDKSLLTPEEQELELQYRDRHIYAVGHGAAVDWCLEDDQPPRIQTDFMPAVEVPQVTTDLAGPPMDVMGMHFLATEPQDRIVPELRRFVAGYEQWVEAQQIAGYSKDEAKTVRRIHSRMKTVAMRMLQGVELLSTDALVFEAFQLANQAMLNQMRQQDHVQGRPRELPQYRWRPFQLAFLLLVMKSSVQEKDDFRDILDLIWFPTGGGKTEAYLGLIAFLIAWRRLHDPDRGGGTVALMRYTLRLLTAQQFARATRIIFALELLRRSNPNRWGDEPISVGIWVGNASSPNRFRHAADKAEEIADGASPPNGLVLDACPWCGTSFTSENYLAHTDNFSFHCTDPDCEFGGANPVPLPCNVVDEALYQQPPSLLIGTIDKFARLTWESRASAFFGQGCLPPALVIQDELHLITGPLGSVAGLYEAALDTVLQMRGCRPKYIASTATIRMATEQVRRLYGRDLAVFPPPGLSCDDSYFAHTDHKEPGRMYMGYLAPRLGTQQCLVPLAAALLVGPQELFDDQVDREALLEAWWTQIVYHVSLKSVGDSNTAYQTEVRRRASWIADEAKECVPGMPKDPANNSIHVNQDVFRNRIHHAKVVQLNSYATARENANTFAQLERPLGDDECLDVVLATNMVSVGLDVSRLALMVVNSPPLTTAEYIQASSRVGRDKVPGLVCVNYQRQQARSLSHYENFRPYHESFYRFVEPTSVTPYTYQVRCRALHAALVIVLRHAGDSLCHNKSARDIDPDNPWVKSAVEALVERCDEAEPDARKGQTEQHIQRLLKEWCIEAERCRKNSRDFFYQARDRSGDSLLSTHEEPDAGLWPTLHSMRNVESSGVLKT